MAAYGALLSLENTIHFLLFESPHILLLPPCPDILKFAYKEVYSLRQILEELNDSKSSSSSTRRNRLNALEMQTKEAACKLEDVIESHVLNQILSQSERRGDGVRFVIDLLDRNEEIRSFIRVLMTMGRDYINELSNSFPGEDEDEALPSRIDFAGTKSKMVGLSDQLNEMKNLLTSQTNHDSNNLLPNFRRVFSLVGMAGIGKTTLARKIFEDPSIVKFFNRRVWVTVGRKYRFKEIRESFLAQLDPDMDKNLMKREDKIGKYLKKKFKGKRCLVVLDDVWDKLPLIYLRWDFPYEVNESRFLVTTRIEDIDYHRLDMRFLDTDESWDLLREKVFGEESCPPQLERFGKMIAENCEGLPLMIIKVANLLSKAEKTLEYWSELAARKSHQLFIDAYHQILKVLYPSYENLLQHSKMCFLYMGVFPQNCLIPCSTLINMLIAERFTANFDIRENAMYCLKELVSNSIAMAYQKSSSEKAGIKTCGLHSSFWHLCCREAGKNKFFHALNSHRDCLPEYIERQNRLCVHNSVLFGIKDVYNSMKDNCASTARSLLCLGPYNQYQVPIFCESRLLRVLDALKIRFYEFPMEVLNLVLLRYLALTYNGNLPASITRLPKLEFLIVGRHLLVKSFGASSYLPMEIWNMHELKHLQITGNNLLQLPNWGASLEKLLTLLDVSPRSCTAGVLTRIPNLKKLGIRIELTHDGDEETLHCLDRIHHLCELRSLKCVVVNPDLRSKFFCLPAPHSMIRSVVQKLHLSGLGYPWEYMNIIASMPNLRVLKLRHYAFQGPKWEIQENGFMYLVFLLIEDTDLVQWSIGCGSFPSLARLSLKHCYKLEEIHGELHSKLETIEVVDCNPLAVTCAKEIKEAQSRKCYRVPDVHSSWDDGKLKSFKSL